MALVLDTAGGSSSGTRLFLADDSGDIDNDGVEELVVSFSGYGLYYFDEIDGWQFLNAVIPDDMKPINFYP